MGPSTKGLSGIILAAAIRKNVKSSREGSRPMLLIHAFRLIEFSPKPRSRF